MSTPAYLGPATILAEGQEIDVLGDLTGEGPESGPMTWNGTLQPEEIDADITEVEQNRRGRIRLPNGWEAEFVVTRIVPGAEAPIIWIEGSEPDTSGRRWG